MRQTSQLIAELVSSMLLHVICAKVTKNVFSVSRLFSMFSTAHAGHVMLSVVSVCVHSNRLGETFRGSKGHKQGHIVWEETLCSFNPVLMLRPWSYIHTRVMCHWMSYSFRLSGPRYAAVNLCAMGSNYLLLYIYICILVTCIKRSSSPLWKPGVPYFKILNYWFFSSFLDWYFNGARTFFFPSRPSCVRWPCDYSCDSILVSKSETFSDKLSKTSRNTDIYPMKDTILFIIQLKIVGLHLIPPKGLLEGPGALKVIE